MRRRSKPVGRRSRASCVNGSPPSSECTSIRPGGANRAVQWGNSPMSEQSGQRQVSPEDVDFAAQQISAGETSEAVQGKLVERGITPEDALAVLNDAYKRAIYDGAIGLLNQGYSPDAVKEQLVAKGWGQPTAEFVVNDILARNLASRRGRRWERV